MKSHRAEKNSGHFSTKPLHAHQTAQDHFLGFTWVTYGCHAQPFGTVGKHVVWWRELESKCRKHLSLFLLFCPIFLLLESGRVCKSHSFCPRPYVCTAAVVTVALLSVLQLMRSYLCVYMSVSLICVLMSMHLLFQHQTMCCWKSFHLFNYA